MTGLARTRRCLLSVLALPALGSCLGDSPYAEYKYQATIRRTGWGVAHIVADDLGSAAFGQGYAFAQDHACVLADQIVKVRSERARFFGPHAGEGDGAHLNSDFAYLHLEIMKKAEVALAAQTDDVRAIIEGYAAGYNQYLADTGVDQVPGLCRGQPWVRPVSATDLTAYYIDLGMLAGSWQLLQFMATAQPPGRAQLARPAGDAIDALRAVRASGFGSNGWAIGKDRSANGRGMVVANPHFPWEGELKLWESHLTVPGVLNTYGVGLMGVPGALIGFNEDVAWTHTFSSGQRFTIYTLDLTEDDPTVYLYDGEPRKMTASAYTVPVLRPDGTLEEVSRTLWKSHYGPIIGLDPFVWDAKTAITYRDANIDNVKLIEQFSRMNRATSLDEFKKVYAEVGGIPWVNTMAADREGRAWYIDASATPRLTQSAIDRWLVAIEDEFIPSAVYAQAGAVVLDGGDPDNEWTEAPGARSPGLVPFAEQPQIDRDDFVFNANDSYWLANPAAPLEGFSPLHGFERVPQSPRTRMNMVLLTGEDASGDDKFTLEDLQAAIMGNRSMTAELLVTEVWNRCGGAAPVLVKYDMEEREVDLHDACAVLGRWDRRYDPDSVGAALWREFLGTYNEAALSDYGVLFAEGFKPDDPIGTPHTLKPAPPTGDDPVLVGLAKAVLALEAAGLAVDVPLKEAQFTYRGDERFSIPGGQGRDGTANVVAWSVLRSTIEPGTPRPPLVNPATSLTEAGYVVNFGSSFVMTLEYTDDGPRGSAFLTYSQSDDPDSPHYRDQTRLFQDQEWRPLVFTEADIMADPALKVTPVAGGGPKPEGE